MCNDEDDNDDGEDDNDDVYDKPAEILGVMASFAGSALQYLSEMASQWTFIGMNVLLS